MSQIITDVIIGVIILSMLLVVIPIYRNQTNQMARVVEITDQNEKIKEVIFNEVPKLNDIVSGRYIKELLYYYVINEINFSVKIKKSGNTNMITENTYEDINSIIDENYMFFKVNEAVDGTRDFSFEYIETETVDGT